MVAPHPDLQIKIRNTKKLVRENRSHLIPGLVKQFPDQYLALEDFNVINTVKPWVESPQPRTKKLVNSLKTVDTVRDRIIVLYVDFIDQPAQISTDTIYDRFFGPGKSLSSFFTEDSYGKYVPAGEVHGPYRMPQLLSYYIDNQNGFGTYPNNVQKLVEDAINIAVTDTNINWAIFDNSGNHIIDYLMIVHAGAEAAYTGKSSDLWAHVWEISPILRNGFGFKFYGMVSEFMAFATDGQRTGIDSHEYGHLLGLPDLYDYSGNSNGAGGFTLMAYGSWADNAFTPVHLDAWCKNYCGFTNTLIDQPGMQLVKDATSNDINYQYSSQYANEYFLVENRQNTGFDSYLPAHGILIWKVNINQTTNANDLCYKVGLIQADGQRHLENSINYGDPGDSYPGSTLNRSISINTNPSNVLCNGSFPVFTIENITDTASTMAFVALLCESPVVSIEVI